MVLPHSATQITGRAYIDIGIAEFQEVHIPHRHHLLVMLMVGS